MFKKPLSIRMKITFGYYAILIIIIAIFSIILIELMFLEREIISGQNISDLFEMTQQVRRFEKNYFLYGHEEDYQENIRYIANIRELIDRNRGNIASITNQKIVASLIDYLTNYAVLMEQYKKTVGNMSEDGVKLDQSIRSFGKKIVELGEYIAKSERTHLQTTLKGLQVIIIISIVFLSLSSVTVGFILSRLVSRPLKQLQESMESIVDGRFGSISIDSKDREIVSLTNAFNRVLFELESRQKHLVQSEKLASLGTMLSAVAHELNNPLSNISTSCQILSEEIGEADMEYQKELISQIEEQTERARNIVLSLLEFSREKEFKKGVLPLKKLIEETIRFIKGQVPTQVEITLLVPEPLFIFADKQRIQQVFLNLIKNAIDATGAQGKIIIKARHSNASEKVKREAEMSKYQSYRGKCTFDEDAVDIEIRDTGHGIPPDVLPKIFDHFFTTKDVGLGSGLGLSIVNDIIEEHNGCIAVESKVGKGTSFFISLPLPKHAKALLQVIK
jgi:two-component system, NtrC family, sensor kinase